MSDEWTRTPGLQLCYITIEKVSNRELLLGYIREGYSGDHVLWESWREGGHLRGWEGGGGVEVKRGQRVREQIRGGQLTRPEEEENCQGPSFENVSYLWEFGRNSNAVPGWGRVGRLGFTLRIMPFSCKTIKCRSRNLTMSSFLVPLYLVCANKFLFAHFYHFCHLAVGGWVSNGWNVDFGENGGKVEVDQGARLRLQEGELEYIKKKRESTWDGGKGWDVPDLAITMVEDE